MSRFPLTWQSTPCVADRALFRAQLSLVQGDVDGLGTLRLLDAIRTCGLTNHIRFYQVGRL
jgi:hypothetical protein